MARGRLTPTHPHRRPIWTIAGLGFAVVTVAAFGSFVVLATLDTTSSDVGPPPPSALRDRFFYVYAIAIGVTAALSLAASWFWSGMARTPTPTRGLWHITLSMMLASGVLAVITPAMIYFDTMTSGPLFVIQIALSTFFYALACAVVITGPIAFPAGWSTGRWARQLHVAAASPDAVAEHFS